jgi:hypothetical protein
MRANHLQTWSAVRGREACAPRQLVGNCIGEARLFERECDLPPLLVSLDLARLDRLDGRFDA